MILDAISPELLPPTRREDRPEDGGRRWPELHDFSLFHFLCNDFRPAKP